jgi:protein-S-isoprenylcysteine O-methyltransferase Ste14
VLWNVALFSAFALHHSLFAREAIRRPLIKAVPHLERSIYVWAASLLFIVVCWLWEPVAGVAWDLTAGTEVPALRMNAGWLLRAVQIAGIVLAVYSASLIDIWELSGVRQLNSQEPTPNSQGPIEFKTKGPYGWVRHPIYLGWFLIVFPVATMTMTQLVFAVVSCAYILVAIPFEERSLLKSAGAAYERYMRQVRFKLIPGIY